MLKNHQEFAPIVRKLLDAEGLEQAPVRIEYVHSIDLDGDGTEERLINARSGEDCTEPCTPAYAVFLLLRTVRSQPDITVISEAWGEMRFLAFETESSSYADLNGDGVMEMLLFGTGEAPVFGVKTLVAGRLVDVPLGYRFHW